MPKLNQTRREFLKKTTVAVSGILVGCSYTPNSNLSANSHNPEKLNLWVKIASDGKTTITVPSSEMGQGVNTSLPMILAEELDADWKLIRTETALANSDYANPESYSGQMTVGSLSVMGFWKSLRTAGAAAKMMLRKSASIKWSVPLEECIAKNGFIYHSKTNRYLSYGDLAKDAGKLEIPSDPPLKNSKDYKFVGKPMQRLDLPDKTNGTAKFGIDVRLPDMLFATVRQSPVFGGEIDSFDEKAALKIKGVKKVVLVENGIAVVADNTWRAKKGMEALNPQFKNGLNSELDNDQVQLQMVKALNKDGKANVRSEKVLDLEYIVPFLAHTTLEPMNCTVHLTSNFCKVWVPTQNQGASLDAAKDISGLDEKQIEIHTTLLGGGFGRRGETDFVKQALVIAKILKKPVQLTWMREEDIQHDFYRPAGMSRFQIGLDEKGNIKSWNNQLCCPSILKRYFSPMAWFDIDPTSTEGADKLPYKIEDFDLKYSIIDPGVPVGWWNSVGSSFNAFFIESAIDEAAHSANQDPYDFRFKLLNHQPRFLKVLSTVKENSKWGRTLSKSSGLGIAIHKTRGSIGAVVMEITLNNSGNLSLKKVWMAIDCGRAINPDTVKAQMQGGFIFGLSACLNEEITLKDGRVEQSNFHDYQIMRQKGIPDIEVEIIESGHELGGVGEIGPPLAAPVLTNAIYAASGNRYRSLPLKNHGIKIL